MKTFFQKYKVLFISAISIALVTVLAIVCFFPTTEPVFDYSSDDTTMPKGFEDLPPNNSPEDPEHVSIVLPEKSCSSTIYVVNPETCVGLTGDKGLTENEKLLLVSLQGIVAQEQAEIYIGKKSDKWIKSVAKEYNLELETKKDLTELITMYKDRLHGYVRATWKGDNTENDQINQASTLAGLEQLLIVAVKDNNKGQEVIDTIENLGLTCKHDLVNDQTTAAQVIETYIDELNKDILILQVPSKSMLRDFGIAQQAAFYFYDGIAQNEEAESVLFKMNPLSIAFGWEEITVGDELVGEIEDDTVARLAKHNMGLVPADFCENLSLWNALPREKMQQKELTQSAQDDENGQYHYVTMLMSDGDNIQCWQGLPFDTSRVAYENRNELAMGWTATPILLETMPMVMQYTYEQATPMEEFVCSISGYTFTKLSSYHNSAMQAYVKKTARLMADADMHCVALKDDADAVTPVWDELSKYDTVDGGFFMYGKYWDEPGSIYWANEKPLIYDREILWAREDVQQAVEENPAKVAVKLNHYTKDMTKAEGYTFIQVHYWSYTYADLYETFYQNLDLNQVKVVTPSEFVSLISENVSHENQTLMKNEEIVNALGYNFTKANGYYMTEAYPMWTRLDDTSEKLVYSDGWTSSTTASGLNCTSHTANIRSEDIKLTFEGTQFKIFMNTGREGGYFSLYVDGKLVAENVSAYSLTSKHFQEIYSMDGLKQGEHTVRIKVMNKKESRSEGTNVSFDAIFYK